MPDQETIHAHARVVANSDRAARIDVAHLHDQAVASDHETRIRKLQSADKDLLVKLAAFADFDMRRVHEGQRPDLDVRPQPNRLPANRRAETDLNVIPNLD